MGVFTSGSAGRSRSLKSVLGGIAVLGTSALILGGCAATTEEEPAGPAEDLTLTIDTILPQSGALAFLGPPEEAGVALAVQEINEAGTSLTVDAIYRDSGDTTTDTATVSVTDLLSQDVDAIIGAASSGVSFTVIDQITGAGVVHFSPARLGSGTATRKLGSAAAIRSAARSWACSSVALKAGFAIFSTPATDPSVETTVKFRSCWLPRDVALARSP